MNATSGEGPFSMFREWRGYWTGRVETNRLRLQTSLNFTVHGPRSTVHQRWKDATDAYSIALRHVCCTVQYSETQAFAGVA
jgi:hypothetical protein